MNRAGGSKSPWSRRGRCATWMAYALVAVGKPQVPSTDWTVRIPVADDRTTVLEIADDPDRRQYLEIGADSSMALRINQEINRQETLEGRLTVRPVQQPDPVETELGAITIPAQDVENIPPLRMSTLTGQETVDTGGFGADFPPSGSQRTR